MKEIKIDGLTKEQCEMLDVMWSIDSIEEFSEWMGSLTTKELVMALSLQELLVYHTMDEIDDISLAKQYLKKFQL